MKNECETRLWCINSGNGTAKFIFPVAVTMIDGDLTCKIKIGLS